MWQDQISRTHSGAGRQWSGGGGASGLEYSHLASLATLLILLLTFLNLPLSQLTLAVNFAVNQGLPLLKLSPGTQLSSQELM